MTQAAHTPGKVLISGSTVYALDDTSRFNRFSILMNGGFVKDNRDGGPAVRTSEEELRANAERFHACWNALEGIPDPSVVGEVIEALAHATSCLCSLRKNYENTNLGLWQDVSAAITNNNAILAKLDGKAS